MGKQELYLQPPDLVLDECLIMLLALMLVTNALQSSA